MVQFRVGDHVLVNFGQYVKTAADGYYVRKINRDGTFVVGPSPKVLRKTLALLVPEAEYMTFIGYEVGDTVRVKDRPRGFRTAEDKMEKLDPYGTVVELRPELGGVLVKHEDGQGPFGWAFDEVEPAGRSALHRLLDDE